MKPEVPHKTFGIANKYLLIGIITTLVLSGLAIGSTSSITADTINAMNGFGVPVGSFLDAYSCDGKYCVYVPWYDSSNVYAKNMTTGLIDYVNPNGYLVTNVAIGNLTPNRNWKETVTIQGNISIGSGSIRPTSYTQLELKGNLIGSGNIPIRIIDANNVSVLGGTVDSKRASTSISIEDSSQDVLIQGVTINGSNPVGILLTTSGASLPKRVTIDQNRILNSTENGIYLFHTSGNNVISNNFIDNTVSGTGHSLILASQSVNTQIDNNILSNSGEHGIYAAAMDNSSFTRNLVEYVTFGGIRWDGSIDSTISGNIVHGGQDGFFNNPGASPNIGLLLTNNQFIRQSRYGIDIEGVDSSTISHNTIYKSGAAGILVQKGQNNIFDFNTIENSSSYGLFLRSTSSNNTYYGNNINTSKLYGIYSDFANTNDTIRGNTIKFGGDLGMRINSGNIVQENRVLYNQVGGIFQDGINVVTNNEGIGGFNWGVRSAAPYAYGASDTYYDSDLSNLCIATAAGTGNWLEVKDMTTGCT